MDSSTQDHKAIFDLLPDFALGKLDEERIRRVSRHLETCPRCSSELAVALDVVGTLAAVAPPRAWIRSAILWRVSAGATRPDRPAVVAPEVAMIRADLPDRPAPSVRRLVAPIGRALSGRMLAVASAAALLLIGAAGWGYERRAENAQHDQIAALVSDPATAHPLDDSELADQATGVVFVDPNGRDVYLIAHGLPALPSDQRYQVWLFTKESTRISAGLLQPAPDGEVRALLETPSPATDYVGLALSAEPIAGSAEPTSVMTLGGAL